MTRIVCVLFGFVAWLVPAAALATGTPPIPMPPSVVPEPGSALLFAAGFAVIAISVRMIRRK